MSKIRISAALLLLCWTASNLFGALPLAENGQTSWKIILPSDAYDVEKTAADELQTHLKAITGAEFPIDTEDNIAENQPNLFLVGRTKRSAAIAAEAGKDDFAFDEIFIKAIGGDAPCIILTGHGRRGMLYAVYEFLERTANVHWFAPDCTVIPPNPSLTVPDDLFVSYAPKMISREMYHRLAQEGIFSARNKGNGNIAENYGGRISILNFVHSFYKILPPEKYFADHPEWYSEINGKRTHEQAQLCLTNDEMRAELTKNVLQSLRDNPNTKMIDISQNDYYNYCECPKCKALDEAEESHAGTLLAFLNQVAADVEKEFPDVLVETLAYQYTRKPPKNIRPRQNILIRLCSIECSFLEPVTGPKNADFLADLDGWSNIARQLFIWDYVTNYNDYIGPHPNWDALAENIRSFVGHGAIGLFEEGEGDDFCEMKNWVLMKLMWDPSLDEKTLMREFCDGYYGPEITPAILEYWDILQKRAREISPKLGCFGAHSAQWLDLATLNQANEKMNRALAKAVEIYGKDSPQAARVTKSKMALDSVWLNRYQTLFADTESLSIPFEGPNDPRKAIEEFIAHCERFQTIGATIGTTDEDFQEWQKTLLKTTAVVKCETPPMCEGLSERDWLCYDDAAFVNYLDKAKRIEDPAAWDGWTTAMPTEVDWNTSFAPQVTGVWKVYASLRCDAAADEGAAGAFGAYNDNEKKHLATRSFSIQDVKGDHYKWIELGPVDFTKGGYIWFAHSHNEAVSLIYVDRLLLVREKK